MMEITKPRIIVEEADNGCFGRFIVEPLEKGFGITLGNCLRRTLLGALPGAAAVAIRIDGIQHEFSSVVGVTEDVTDIVLNIKNLAVRTTSLEPDFRTVLHLRKKGAGEVLAKDIELDDQVEILNPELHICTLDDNADLNMDIIIGRGRGYIPASNNKTEDDPIGYIAVDSIFTPVKSVNYSVAATRVGQSMDYDKLTMEVQTNGTMSAREIISLSAKVVLDHVKMFVDLVDSMGDMEILVNPEPNKQVKVLEMAIEDLTKKSKEDMLKVRNLGLKSLEEVINKLESYGLSLRNDDE